MALGSYTSTYSLPSNVDSMSQRELIQYYDKLPDYVKSTPMGQKVKDMYTNYGKKNTYASTTAASTSTASGPRYSDISSLYDKALSSLSTEGEAAYQQGKRRTLSDIAMQSINAGMANTLNMPAAGVAYDEANRTQFNLALGEQKANLLSNQAQTAAGIYGTNVGAQTSLATARIGADTSKYATDVGAGTSLQSAQMQANVDAAKLALQKYIADLNAKTTTSGGSLSAVSR